MEEHEAAKQLVEMEKAALLETLNECGKQLERYSKLVKMLDEQVSWVCPGKISF